MLGRVFTPAPAVGGEQQQGEVLTAAPAPAAAHYRELVLELVEASPTNPRRTFNPDKHRELVASVAAHGVLQPVLVRPHPTLEGRYECVAGERRRRAAVEARLGSLPAIERAMTDKAVLEIQLIENGQREDVHPLEEAVAIGRLHDEPYRVPIEEIAPELGKSVAYVYRRLRLRQLHAEVQEVFVAGVLTLGAAEQLARIPDADRQRGVLKEMRELYPPPLSANTVAEFLRRRVFLRLAGASFDRQDETLPGGACEKCPKRTGAQRELFDEGDQDDMCLDADCFAKKTDAAWERVAAAAEAKGKRVLTETEGRKIFAYGTDSVAHGAGFVEASARCWGDSRHRTFKQLVGKEAPLAIARTPSGAPVELYARPDVVKTLQAKGLREAASAADGGAKEREKDRERTRTLMSESRRRREVNRRAIAKVVEAAEAAQPQLTFWRLLLNALLDHVWYEVVGVVAMRRGVVQDKNRGRAEQALRKAAERMSAQELSALVLELLVMRGADSPYGARRLVEACGLYKVDYKSIEREVKAGAGGGQAKSKAIASGISAKPKAAASAKNLAKGTKTKAAGTSR